MRVCGVICEYNPFHQGHAHHLARARALSGADFVVCAMSGAVTQRGVFARHDKWTRARMALLSGADLVVELPARFACAPAPDFAAGGVSLLSALGIVTHLSFGCEREAIPLLGAAAESLGEESPRFLEALRLYMDAGMAYPRARALAAQAASGIDGLAEIIAAPNAALALEYLRALEGDMTPVPVAREGAGYHDDALGEFSSATAVRAALSRGALEAACAAVPSPDLLRAAEERGDFCREDALDQSLLYVLRSTPADRLACIAGMDEGLEHRFIAAARKADSREELLSQVKSKRYTHARLSRAAMHALLGVSKAYMQENRTPTYARILGLRRDAQPLMKLIKENARIPLITKAADFDRDDPLFALDVRAQDLWSLGCENAALRRSGRDFTAGPVILP